MKCRVLIPGSCRFVPKMNFANYFEAWNYVYAMLGDIKWIMEVIK